MKRERQSSKNYDIQQKRTSTIIDDCVERWIGSAKMLRKHGLKPSVRAVKEATDKEGPRNYYSKRGYKAVDTKLKNNKR